MVEAPDPRTFKPQYPQEVPFGPSLGPLPAVQVVKASSSSDILAEEGTLIAEARNLGKPWSDIARMLPEQTVKALKRQYTLLQKPKVTDDGKIHTLDDSHFICARQQLQ